MSLGMMIASSGRAIWRIVAAILLFMTQACDGSNGNAESTTNATAGLVFAYERERFDHLDEKAAAFPERGRYPSLRRVVVRRLLIGCFEAMLGSSCFFAILACIR